MWNQPQLYVSHTTARVLPELFLPIENDRFGGTINKPFRGGLWTAPYDARKRTSPWVEWCTHNDFLHPYQCDWWLLTPKYNANVFTIESYEHLVFLTETYPLKRERPPFLSKNYPLKNDQRINFELAAASGLDAIAITSRGIVQTERSTPNLWGWDMPSILWLRWAFTRVKKIRTPQEKMDENDTRVVSRAR